MATVAEGAAGVPRAVNSERRFYTFYTIGLFLLALIGFSRSFYLSWVLPVFEPLFPLSPLVVAHGILASALILLFPLQALLFAGGKRKLHMVTGAGGLALAALLLVIIYLTAAEGFQRPSEIERPMRATGVVLPLSLIPLMAVFLWLGWRNRQSPQAHKRWMILAGCVLVAPAIARIPVMSVLLPGNPLLGFVVGTQLLMFATVIPLWIRDRRTFGRIHRATLWGSIVFFLVLALRVPLGIVAGQGIIAVLPGF